MVNLLEMFLCQQLHLDSKTKLTCISVLPQCLTGLTSVRVPFHCHSVCLCAHTPPPYSLTPCTAQELGVLSSFAAEERAHASLGDLTVWCIALPVISFMWWARPRPISLSGWTSPLGIEFQSEWARWLSENQCSAWYECRFLGPAPAVFNFCSKPGNLSGVG